MHIEYIRACILVFTDMYERSEKRVFVLAWHFKGKHEKKYIQIANPCHLTVYKSIYYDLDVAPDLHVL